jgi:dolichol-phosphate mannosyltransferase
MASDVGVSVVTTTWNEKENIGQLVAEVRQVLRGVTHEVIVVDDSSSDGTLQVAEQVADLAVSKPRKGQTAGLLHGMKLAKYPLVVTIDSDLENPPALIPELLRLAAEFDVVVASRTQLPRFSEKYASRTLGKLVGITDFYSNFRLYKKGAVATFELHGGETFGAEFLLSARKHGFKLGEVMYPPPPRRRHPRIGGSLRANLRIQWATTKAFALYLFWC